MYKRAREVAELLPLRCILNGPNVCASHWSDFILEQVNDATRSHEVVSAQSKIAHGQLGHYDGLPDCTLL